MLSWEGVLEPTTQGYQGPTELCGHSACGPPSSLLWWSLGCRWELRMGPVILLLSGLCSPGVNGVSPRSCPHPSNTKPSLLTWVSPVYVLLTYLTLKDKPFTSFQPEPAVSSALAVNLPLLGIIHSAPPHTLRFLLCPGKGCSHHTGAHTTQSEQVRDESILLDS